MHTISIEDFSDYIGMESCVDLKAGVDDIEVPIPSHHHPSGGGVGCSRRREKKEKAFPPPLPLPSQKSWELKRYCTADGRLIIKEEKVRRHEYFRAHRADGRLTLHLIPLDEGVSSAGEEEEGEEKVVQKEDKVKGLDCLDKNGEDLVSNVECNGCDNNGKIVIPENIVLAKDRGGAEAVAGGGSGGGGEMWFKFDGVRSSPCMYVLPVPAISPVHI